MGFAGSETGRFSAPCEINLRHRTKIVRIFRRSANSVGFATHTILCSKFLDYSRPNRLDAATLFYRLPIGNRDCSATFARQFLSGGSAAGASVAWRFAAGAGARAWPGVVSAALYQLIQWFQSYRSTQI